MLIIKDQAQCVPDATVPSVMSPPRLSGMLGNLLGEVGPVIRPPNPDM